MKKQNETAIIIARSANPTSVQSQLEQCLRVAKMKGFRVVKQFVLEPDKDEFHRVRKIVEAASECDAKNIIAVEPSRIAKNFKAVADLLGRVHDLNIELHWTDREATVERLIFQTKKAIGETHSDRVKTGLQRRNERLESDRELKE